MVVPSGDHQNSSTPRGRSDRRRASPPSSGRRWTWSMSWRSLRSFGRSGSSSTASRRSLMNASVRPSGENRAWRSRPRPERRLARLAGPVDRRQPHGRAVAVAGHGAALDRERDPRAVRGQPGVGRDGEPVQVVGTRGSGQGVPPLVAWTAAARGMGGRDGAGPVYPGRGATIGPRWPSSSPSSSSRRSPARGTSRPCGRRRAPDPFDADDWLFEPTWGGHRVLVFVGPADLPGGGDVRVMDARGAAFEGVLPELAGLAVRVAARSAVLDGELVVVDARGRADDDALARPAVRAARAGRGAAGVRPAPPRRPLAARPAARQAAGGAATRAPAGRRGRGRPRDHRRGAGAPRRGLRAGHRGRAGAARGRRPTCPG